MQIARDPNVSVTVRHVEPGEVRIGDRTITQDVMITPERDVLHWPTGEVEQLAESDFSSLLELEPEVILLGTGWQPVPPPRELVFAMARRGVVTFSRCSASSNRKSGTTGRFRRARRAASFVARRILI